jgi:hypothetical protein
MAQGDASSAPHRQVSGGRLEGAPNADATAFDTLTRDLRRIFDRRLASLIAYGEGDADGVHTLALVDQLTFGDLAKCVPLTSGWHRLGLATPLMLTADEFRRSLDVFPLEYGDIIAHHVVLSGSDPFTPLVVAEADLRRGCERQVKSHLIHLREGFLETGGNPADVAELLAASAAPLRKLLAHLESLEPGAAARAGLGSDLIREIAAAADATIADPSALLARYLTAVERLWQYVDAWR